MNLMDPLPCGLAYPSTPPPHPNPFWKQIPAILLLICKHFGMYGDTSITPKTVHNTLITLHVQCVQICGCLSFFIRLN